GVTPYPAIGKAQPLHLRAYAEGIEGLHDFARTHVAQARGRPGGVAGIAGFAIGHCHQLDVEPGLAGGAQKTAACEGLVVRMRREQHHAVSALQQLRWWLFVQRSQPWGRAPCGFALARAMDARRGYSGHRASASRAATCAPGAAQSRSAWLWRTNTARSAQRRACSPSRHSGPGPRLRAAASRTSLQAPATTERSRTTSRWWGCVGSASIRVASSRMSADAAPSAMSTRPSNAARCGSRATRAGSAMRWAISTAAPS